MIPTRRAAIVVGAAALSMLVLPAQLVFGAIGIAFIACCVDAIFARQSLQLKRSVPKLLILGVPTPLEVTHDVKPGDGRVRLRQPQTPDLRLDPSVAVGTLTTNITALRRGRHELPGVAARRRGPLGLADWDFKGDAPTAVTVYPDVPAARRIAHAVRTRSFRDAGEIRRGPLGLGTEFESIREYQPDDDVRQVNWNATLRAGRPMSNQFRVETEREVLCLVDCGRLMAAPINDRTRLDIAIDATTAVAHVADVLGDRCGTIAFDNHIIRHLAHRRRGADAIVHAIHALEPSLADSDYDLAFRTIRNTKRALIVVFTDLLDIAAAHTLLEAVPVLTRRHAVIVATARDPHVRGALTSEPSTRDDLYRAAVALRIDEARNLVAIRLRAAGAILVDAEPRQFSEAVVGAYLRLKDSARI